MTLNTVTARSVIQALLYLTAELPYLGLGFAEPVDHPRLDRDIGEGVEVHAGAALQDCILDPPVR